MIESDKYEIIGILETMQDTQKVMTAIISVQSDRIKALAERVEILEQE